MSETQGSKNEQIRIRPTLIIGLGGTGGDVVMRIRRRFYESYGSLAEFPIVGYLWLDTDRSEKHILSREIRDFVRLTDTERLMMTINDTTAITQNLKEPGFQHIDKWWYPGLNSLGQMNEGAGQIRAYSRLAFFHHYQAIRAAIVDANKRIRDPLAQEVMMKSPILKDQGLLAQVEFNQPTNVYLVSSIAGGTGSGMLMDVSFLVKDVFQEGNVTVCSFLVFPDHFGSVTNDRMKANSYALLKELNYYQFGVSHFNAEWTRGTTSKVAIPPFDYCYVFDNQNAAGQVTGGQPGSQELVFELLADSIFKDFSHGEFADHKRSARINLRQYMNKTFDYEHPRFKQRFIQRYGSLGMASIMVPHARIITACAHRLAAEIVDRWGGLSAADFNDADLPRLVRQEVMAKVRLQEDEKNHDLLYALLDTQGLGDPDKGKTRGLIDELTQWKQKVLTEVERGVYRQQNVSLRDFLDRAHQDCEKSMWAEQLGANADQWGYYPRTVRANLEALLKRSQEALQQHAFSLIDQKNESLRFAEAVLKEASAVLQQTADSLAKQSQDLQTKLERRQKEVQRRLAEVARQQNRSGWDGRKGVILAYVADRFLECLVGDRVNPGLLRCLLQDRIYKEGIEFCKRLIPALSGQVRADGSLAGGVRQQLDQLQRDLGQMKADLMVGYNYFSQKEKLPQALLLYEATDVEKKYYPAYVKPNTISDTSKAVLSRLERSVTGLSVDLAAGRSDAWKRALLAECRQVFLNVRGDFHVVKVLFSQVDEASRVHHLKQIFARSAYWVTRAGIHGTFRIPAEQVHTMVGLPGPTPDMDPGQRSELEGYITQLKNLAGRELSTELRYYPMPDSSELIFYQEAGGFPINYSSRLPDLREAYLKLYTAGEHLHIDCRDKKFPDLMILTTEERQALEEAYQCFVLGSLYNLLEYKGEDYVWMERDGFQMRPHPLGDQFMTLLRLSTHAPTREKLFAKVREQRQQLLSSGDEELLARYAAILELTKRQAWGEDWGRKTDETELPFEQMMSIRVLNAEVEAVLECPLVRRLGADSFAAKVNAYVDGPREALGSLRQDGRMALKM
ncbi:MAG: tubulin-like doman-containing protein [Vulcanimicrobiota bacterium]